MTAIINAVSELVNALFVTTTGEGAHTAWVVSVINTITSNGILLIGVITGLSGLAVGMVRRLMNIK